MVINITIKKKERLFVILTGQLYLYSFKNVFFVLVID